MAYMVLNWNSLIRAGALAGNMLSLPPLASRLANQAMLQPLRWLPGSIPQASALAAMECACSIACLLPAQMIGVWLEDDDGDDLLNMINRTAGGNSGVGSAEVDAATGEYHLYGFTWIAGTRHKLYYDGRLILNTEDSDTSSGGLGNIFLGGFDSNNSGTPDTSWFNGGIAMVAAWDRELTASEWVSLARDPFYIVRPRLSRRIFIPHEDTGGGGVQVQGAALGGRGTLDGQGGVAVAGEGDASGPQGQASGEGGVRIEGAGELTGGRAQASGEGGVSVAAEGDMVGAGATAQAEGEVIDWRSSWAVVQQQHALIGGGFGV